MVRAPDEIELERPYPFAEVDMRDEALCTECGVESYPWPASELTVVAHRHPKRPGGLWRIYCGEHLAKRPPLGDDGYLPEFAPAAGAAKSASKAKRKSNAKAAPRAPRTASSTAMPPSKTARRYLDDEPPTAVCPNCFVSVSLTGICAICGDRIAL